MLNSPVVTEADFPSCAFADRFRPRAGDRLCLRFGAVTPQDCHGCALKGSKSRAKVGGSYPRPQKKPKRPPCQHAGEATEFIPCACPAIQSFPILACTFERDGQLVHGECVAKLVHLNRIPKDHDASGCQCCERCDEYSSKE
jgi:hypothetical protein